MEKFIKESSRPHDGNKERIDMTKFTYNGIDYDTKAPHGSPFDRGSADSYYWRPVKPHYYVHTPGEPSTRYEIDKMTPEQVQAYYAGYEYNEMLGDYKSYDDDVY